jgi:hypothetical protein
MTVYQSSVVDQTITDNRNMVEQHQLDPANGRCAACGAIAPCRTANTAVNVLANMGVLGAISQPPTFPSGPEGSLLTYGWKIVFGLEKPRRPRLSVRS